MRHAVSRARNVLSVRLIVPVCLRSQGIKPATSAHLDRTPPLSPPHTASCSPPYIGLRSPHSAVTAHASSLADQRPCGSALGAAAVPTLCLTSPDDLVVPERGVRAYADALSKAHPGRDVRVVSLHGPHCKLVMSDRELYAEAVGQLVEVRMDSHAAACTA
jgi:hypothetical protein